MSDTMISGSAAEPSTRLYNEDLAPARERNWGTYADVHSIGGYTFAAGLYLISARDFRQPELARLEQEARA